MSALQDVEDEGLGLIWQEAVIRISSISSLVYNKELTPFLSKDKEKEYEEKFNNIPQKE